MTIHFQPHVNQRIYQPHKADHSDHLNQKKQPVEKPIEDSPISYKEMTRNYFDYVMRVNKTSTSMGTNYMRALTLLALNGHTDDPQPALKLTKALIRAEEQLSILDAAQKEIKRLIQVEENNIKADPIKTPYQLATHNYMKLAKKQSEDIFKTPPRTKEKPTGSPQSVTFISKQELEPKKEPKQVRFNLPKKVHFAKEPVNKNKSHFFLPWDII